MAKKSLKSIFINTGIGLFIGYKGAMLAAPDTMLGKIADRWSSDDEYRECVGSHYQKAIEQGFTKNPVSRLISTVRIRDFCLKQFPG